jgi:hypothetical protein
MSNPNPSPGYQPPYGQPQRQPPQFAPQPPQPVPPPKKTKRFGWVAMAVTAAVALIIGAVGASGNSTTTAGPAATTTVTAPPTATMTIYKTADQPTQEPTDQPTASYTPKKSDWKIGIKILKNTCFDTAGASISYRIKPEFVGTVKPPEAGTVEVSYRVTGGQGGPNDNTFTVTGGQMSYDEQEDVDTPSCSTKLKATVTDVSYTG